ncbi:hypothetical protein B0O99DRAFT_652834 [Bisporella sp. PMI_857]|nr:hypothetical protein B0O99DRAFT_652834 [Bisporella sp. PMI_857]
MTELVSRRDTETGWLSWALRLPALGTFLVLDIIILAVLIALNSEVTTFGINWNLGLLWTTLPTLVFRLTSMYWDWIASAMSDWQPYVELSKNGGSRAQRSILLDYRSTPLLWRWFQAFTNAHFLVATCLLLSLSSEIGSRTAAYSAKVNCSSLTDYQLNLEASNLPNQDHIFITANDRGYDISQDFGVAEVQKVYFKMSSKVDCGAGVLNSRLIFTSRMYSASSPALLSNISVISCITGYRATTGLLTISKQGTNYVPTISSLTLSGTLDNTRLAMWRGFEQSILSPTSFNIQSDWSTSMFGSLVLYCAQNISPEDYLSSNILMHSISDIFTAVYLTGAAMYDFAPLSSQETTAGALLAPTLRLFVVSLVAYVVLIVVFATAISAISIVFYVRTRPSILTAEPTGLLSYAGILQGSPLMKILRQACIEPDFDGRLVKQTKASCNILETLWEASRDK